MVIWITSCRASSVVDSGMSMRRQIFGSSSCQLDAQPRNPFAHRPVPSVFPLPHTA